VSYLTQMRSAGRFVVGGTLPTSVDVNATPKTSFGGGVLHITLADHIE
jgi:HSP20 family molecular chaperone IbpA